MNPGFFAAVLRVLSVAVGLAVFPVSAQTDSPTARSKPDAIRAGFYDLTPLVFKDANGKPGGLFIEVLEAVAEREKWQIQYVHGSWPESLARLENGEIDLLVSVSFSEDRARRLDYSRDSVATDWGLIYRPRRGKLESIRDLDGARISCVRNGIYTKHFRRLAEDFGLKVELVEREDYKEVIADVESGRSQAGIGSNLAGMALEASSSVERSPIVFAPIKVMFATKKGARPELIAGIDRQIEALKTDPAAPLQKMQSKWLSLGQDEETPFWVFATMGGLLGSALLLGIFAIAARRAVRKATTELRESEMRFRRMADEAPALIWITNERNEGTWYNQRWLNFTGRSMEQELGSGWLAGIHPDDRVTEAHCHEAFHARRPFEVEFRLRKADGNYGWIADTGLPRYGEDGAFLGYIGYCWDVTDRKQVELKLASSEMRFRSYFELPLIGVAITSLEKGWLEINPRLLEMLGYSRDELVGLTWAEITYPDDLSADLESFERVLNGQIEGYSMDKRFVRKDGKVMDTALSVRCVRREDGSPDYFVALIQDISERKQAERELESYRDHLEELVETRTNELTSAKSAAEAASIAKSAFLANMSHEIRTPMNAILGMANLMRREGVTPHQADRLDKIDAASHHLLGLINDILDLSKIEAGRFSIDSIPMSLDQIVAHVRDLTETLATSKGLSLIIAAPTLSANLLGDPMRLQQSLINLVSNAIKFTETGSVTLRLEVLEETVEHISIRCAVIDTGIGIPEDKMERLFSNFEQGDNSTARKYGGTGLGLAITKRLIELMGGQVGAESMPGAGSTFWVTLSLKKSQAGTERVRVEQEEMAELVLKRNYSGTRVLLADDEPINLEISQSLLLSCGMLVDTADNGADALRMALEGDYAIILMDMQMPAMGGVEAARGIRVSGIRQMPIIALTANAQVDDREECLNAGMNDFLTKPCKPNMLFGMVLKWLSSGNC